MVEVVLNTYSKLGCVATVCGSESTSIFVNKEQMLFDNLLQLTNSSVYC